MTGGYSAPSVDSIQSVGRYALVAELGRGGTATVFLAVPRDEPNGRPVVLKVLRAYDEDRELRRMFGNESQLALRLHHPNVVRTFDVGRDGKHAFLVMEYLEGRPLAKLLGPAGDVPLPLALFALVEALDGLHYAHELHDPEGQSYDIVHRDISPFNIFITYDGGVKVLDFGAAKFIDSMATTAAGAIKGRLRYMAPEQASGQRLDRRADIFSMGIVLWQAITGRALWADLDSATVVSRLLGGDIPTPGPARGDVSPELVATCQRALSSDPARRFQTAADFADALRAELPRFGERASREALRAYLDARFAAEKEQAGRIVSDRLRHITVAVTPLAGSARPSFTSRRPQRPSRARYAAIPAVVVALLAPLLWLRFNREAGPAAAAQPAPPAASVLASPPATDPTREPPAAPAAAPSPTDAPSAAAAASLGPPPPTPALKPRPVTTWSAPGSARPPAD
jgi:eukaryotic-like serine/threonine-protein kinase